MPTNPWDWPYIFLESWTWDQYLPKNMKWISSILNSIIDWRKSQNREAFLFSIQAFRFPPVHQPNPWGTRVVGILFSFRKLFIWPKSSQMNIECWSFEMSQKLTDVRLQPNRSRTVFWALWPYHNLGRSSKNRQCLILLGTIKEVGEVGLNFTGFPISYNPLLNIYN